MKIRMNIVDAFTKQLFRGNPAAVVVIDEWLSDEQMQLIATENNLSETAFSVVQPNGHYQIRWFSPMKEIDFCGHATLATSFVLFNRQRELNELTFYAESVGELRVEKLADGSIEMCFPNRKPELVEAIPSELLQALSIRPIEVWRSEQAYFAVFAEELEVKSLSADFEELKKLAPWDLVATAPGRDYDFVSRYFWPANGGDEDPVTGSIHAGLAPFWAEKFDKEELIAFQASARGGVVKCRVEGESVFVSGTAVEYLDGYIRL